MHTVSTRTLLLWLLQVSDWPHSSRLQEDCQISEAPPLPAVAPPRLAVAPPPQAVLPSNTNKFQSLSVEPADMTVTKGLNHFPSSTHYTHYWKLVQSEWSIRTAHKVLKAPVWC